MPIIETEKWVENPDRPGTIIFDSQRKAEDVFNDLAKHLKTDGRLPDEYFMLSVMGHWGDGALFPKDADIRCSANYGGNEGIYLDITVSYVKPVYGFDEKLDGKGWVERYVTEPFATGKTLGESIDDFDRMNLAAASVTAAFYGGKAEVLERYAKVEAEGVKPPNPSIPEGRVHSRWAMVKGSVPARDALSTEKPTPEKPIPENKNANGNAGGNVSGKDSNDGLMNKLNANKLKVAEKDSMKNFDVTITETLRLTVYVKAKSAKEAEETVEKDYWDSKHVLSADHYDETEFIASEVPKEHMINLRHDEASL